MSEKIFVLSANPDTELQKILAPIVLENDILKIAKSPDNGLVITVSPHDPPSQS